MVLPRNSWSWVRSIEFARVRRSLGKEKVPWFESGRGLQWRRKVDALEREQVMREDVQLEPRRHGL